MESSCGPYDYGELIATIIVFTPYKLFNSRDAKTGAKRPFKMPFLSHRRALQLQNELKGTKATVVVPEDEHYAELIRRWSDTSEREAVCHDSVPHPKRATYISLYFLILNLC